MRKYLIKIRYNGKRYCGLVPQPHKKTILGEIFNRIGKPIKFKVCSRTDKGVSAYENYVYLEYNKEIRFPKIINKDIKILEVKEIEENVRFKDIVKNKVYIYIWKIDKPIYKPKYIVHEGNRYLIEESIKDFNIERISKNLKYFIKERSFHNFTNIKGNTKCFIEKIHIKKVKDCLYFEFKGKRFLYQMVRRLVSFFISLGYGMINEDYIKYVTEEGWILDPKPPAISSKNLLLYKINLKNDT